MVPPPAVMRPSYQQSQASAVVPSSTWANPHPPISFLPFLPSPAWSARPLPPPPPPPPPCFLAAISQDAFSLLASFLPLSSLLVLRQLSHRFQTFSLHPHAYASYGYTLRSLEADYLLRLSALHPHLRSLAVPFPQCENATADALSFLFASFPSLASLSLSALPHQPSLPLPSSSTLTSLQLTSPGLPTSAFATLSLVHSLTSLVVTDAALDDNSLLLLSTLPALQRLGLSQCGLLSDRGIGWLLGLDTAATVDDCFTAVNRHLEQRSGWHGAWQSDPGQSAASPTPPPLPSFATLYQLSSLSTSSAAVSSSSSSLPASLPLTRPLTPTALHDHVSAVMDEVGQLGRHSGLSMLSRSMSTPAFARHSTLALLTADETASPPPEDGEDSAEEKEEEEAGSPLSSGMDEGEALLKDTPPLYRPSAVARTLRALDVSHCRLLTDASALYMAYTAVCTASHATCLCYSDPAACTLLPLREVDASYCQSWSDLAVACVAALPHLSALQLSHQPLLSDHALLALQPLPFLARLSLTALPLLSAHSLGTLSSFLSLERLALSALPHLTDHSLLLLSSLPFLARLSVSLSPSLTDLSLLSLSTSGSLRRLSLLSVAHLTQRGLFALARCRGLRRVEVRGCKGVTEEDKERLRHARRDMEVL